jgi:limonene-1,2-epoxide hydrolase
MPDADTPLDLVRRFCAVWPTLDLQGDLKPLLDFFTDDAVYHNIPVAPVVGKDGIKATINMFASGVERMEFRVDHISADGAAVLTERVDVFTLSDGRAIELPVMGTFEVAGGKIAAWRDYFDLNQFMSQLTPS